MDYRCYSLRCWVDFPNLWPSNAGIPPGHPICGQRIYWILEYYDSLEALRYFKHDRIFQPASSKWLKEKVLAYVRKFMPGSHPNVCKEYHGNVSFADGLDHERTIVHESLHMAIHTVNHWFPDRESEFWEERVAYVQEHCFEALRSHLAILRKKNPDHITKIRSGAAL